MNAQSVGLTVIGTYLSARNVLPEVSDVVVWASDTGSMTM